MAAASGSNQAQMRDQEAKREAATETGSWKCSCGALNNGKFCAECGSKKPDISSWKCSCGAENIGKFCSECGKARPADNTWFCPECGKKNSGNFCSDCGMKRP